MARDATAVAGLSVVIAGKAPLEKPLGSSARLLFPPETYQQIGSGRLSYSRGGFREASGRPRAARMSPAAGRASVDNSLRLPPAAVFWSVVPFEALDQAPGFDGRKGFVE